MITLYIRYYDPEKAHEHNDSHGVPEEVIPEVEMDSKSERVDLAPEEILGDLGETEYVPEDD